MESQPPKPANSPGNPQETTGGTPSERGQDYFEQAMQSGVRPDAEECQNAFLAHLLAAICLLICCGVGAQAVAPMAVLILSKRRTAFELFHINQSVFFQLAIFVVNIAWVISVGVLTSLTCGLASALFALSGVLFIAGFVYSIMVALAAKRGEWAKYPFVGDRVLHSKPWIG